MRFARSTMLPPPIFGMMTLSPRAIAFSNAISMIRELSSCTYPAPYPSSNPSSHGLTVSASSILALYRLESGLANTRDFPPAGRPITMQACLPCSTSPVNCSTPLIFLIFPFSNTALPCSAFSRRSAILSRLVSTRLFVPGGFASREEPRLSVRRCASRIFGFCMSTSAGICTPSQDAAEMNARSRCAHRWNLPSCAYRCCASSETYAAHPASAFWENRRLGLCPSNVPALSVALLSCVPSSTA